MTPLQLIAYYANLLILQYVQKPKAYATVSALASQTIMAQTTVQTISFSGVAASGGFVLNYTPFQTTYSTASIAWNASTATIQTQLQTLPGFSSVTVTGSIASGLTITFTGVPPVVPLLTITSNSLQTAGSVAINLTVAETDVILPLALQNAFNINSSLGSVAVGVQLDIIGKYAGVTRSGYSLAGNPITLTDADFLVMINFAIALNSSGSSLSQIQAVLTVLFATGQVFVFDYANFQMSYLLNSSIGSQDLVQLLVSDGLFPKPMAVQLASVIYAPIVNAFFGFRNYVNANTFVSPFNNYTVYTLTWPWLTYQNAIRIR